MFLTVKPLLLSSLLGILRLIWFDNPASVSPFPPFVAVGWYPKWLVAPRSCSGKTNAGITSWLD